MALYWEKCVGICERLRIHETMIVKEMCITRLGQQFISFSLITVRFHWVLYNIFYRVNAGKCDMTIWRENKPVFRLDIFYTFWQPLIIPSSLLLIFIEFSTVINKWPFLGLSEHGHLIAFTSYKFLLCYSCAHNTFITFHTLRVYKSWSEMQ